jgi:hypothetical protein
LFFLGFIMNFSFPITQVRANSTVTGALLLLSQRVLLQIQIANSKTSMRLLYTLIVKKSKSH